MIDHEQTFRARVKIGPEQSAEVARLAGVPNDVETVAAMLSGVVESYIASRISQEARAFPPDRDAVLPSDPWAGWRDDDGWQPDDHDDLLQRKRGGPRNEALLAVYDILAAWWDDLPPPEGLRQRHKWRPSYDVIADQNQVVPANNTGTVFAYIARCLDPTNTPRNCNAVASNIKDRARSPAAKAKREAARKAYQAKPRVKAKRLAAQRARRREE